MEYSTLEARKAYFDKLYKVLGLQSMDDWYKVKGEDVARFGLGPLGLYRRSLSLALEDVYSNHNWRPWRFTEGGTNRKRLWKDPKMRLEFLESVRNDLGYESLEGFYKLTPQTVRALGGGLLLLQSNNSILKLLQSVYSHHTWMPWRFSYVGNATWNDDTNIHQFFQYCRGQLKIEKQEDWYKVKTSQIASLGGASLLARRFGSSLSAALQWNYPEHRFEPWKFHVTPMKWWSLPANQRVYMDWIGSTVLGVKSMDDWYKLEKKHLMENFGSRLISGYYKSSTSGLLRAIFPAHTWQEWKFIHCPKGFWENPSNRRRFLDYVIETKKIDLDGLSIEELRQLISDGDVIREGGTLYIALESSQDEIQSDTIQGGLC